MEVRWAPLGLDTDWMPAIENRGEGIFLQLDADLVNAWLERPAVKKRDALLQRGFEAWKGQHEGSKREYPGLP